MNPGAGDVRLSTLQGMWRMLGGNNIGVVVVAAVTALVGVGCSTDASDPTPTLSSSQDTTTGEITGATTTTIATSTTSGLITTTSAPTQEDPWSVDYPLDVDEVVDVPSALLNRLDAVEPNPDLGIDGLQDPSRWVDEWLAWFSWVNANPEQGIAALEHGVLPGSDFYEGAVVVLESHRDQGTRLLGYAFRPSTVVAVFDELFNQREELRIQVSIVDLIPSYVVDSEGSVVSIAEPSGEAATLDLLLRYREDTGEWVLANLEEAD